MVKDKLAEIAVGNDQNPSLFPGDFKDVFIGKTRRIVTRDDLNVMSEMAKARNKSEVGARLVGEFHSCAPKSKLRPQGCLKTALQKSSGMVQI